MNWKSTVIVSGASVLATWLGYSPYLAPVAPEAAPPDTRPITSDIAAQAERLHVRVRNEMDYREPTRNPFRFSARKSTAAPPALTTPAMSTQPEGPTVSPLPFTLSGMASDGSDAAAQRTAILTTASSDVVFAKQGDQVAGFTITGIDETGIDVTAADGSVRRLILTP
jgi:hypothetical protein